MHKSLMCLSLLLTTTLQCAQHTRVPVTFEQLRKNRQALEQALPNLERAVASTKPLEQIPHDLSSVINQLAQRPSPESGIKVTASMLMASNTLLMHSALYVALGNTKSLLEAMDEVDKLEQENRDLKRAAKRPEGAEHKRGGPAASQEEHESEYIAALTIQNAYLRFRLKKRDKEFAELQEKIAKLVADKNAREGASHD